MHLRLFLLALLVGCGGLQHRTYLPDKCQLDSECGAGNSCRLADCPEDGNEPCPGNVCGPLLATGQACDTDVYYRLTCVAGDTCNGALHFVCEPPQDLGGPCDDDTDCKGATPGGNFCDRQLFICAARGVLAAGARCGDERECGPDLVCAAPKDYGVCLPALPEGADCSNNYGACLDADTCDQGICKRSP